MARPPTDTVLAELPASGVTRLPFRPGFAAIAGDAGGVAIRGRDTFLAAGGSDFAYFPASTTPATHDDAARADRPRA